MKIKSIKKISLVALILMNVSVGAYPAAASVPSASQVAAEMEARYHTNLQSIQNMGENFNVSDLKKMFPQVNLFFSPSNPKPGEKISVMAKPIYFQNNEEDLYYTWYLRKQFERDVDGVMKTIKCDLPKTKEEKEEIKNDDVKLNLCDLDDDDEITVEDWKIAAMREVANGGFDTAEADYKNIVNSDDDGYEADWGGRNGQEDAGHDGDPKKTEAYCYVHDFDTGLDYELRGETSGSGNAEITSDCGDAYKPVCLAETTKTCGGSDKDVCEIAKSGLNCDLNSEGKNVLQCSSGDPYCIENTYYNSFPPSTCLEATEKCIDITPTYGFAADDVGCSTTDEGQKIGKNSCKHLFPHAPKTENEKFITGDGKFTISEEEFWWTDPQDPNTSDNGNMDEANVAGLGISNFSWTYDSGDQIGVAVEGFSMVPTKHADSTMMLAWALPKNNCKIEKSNVSSYSEYIKGYYVKIPTVKMDINDCLEDNLIDPAEGGQATKLEPTLSFFPENPMNDNGEDENGDIVTVNSNISNLLTKDQATVNYDWSIKISEDGNINSDPAMWTTICDSEKCDIFSNDKNEKEISKLKGNNLTSLSFRLNLNEDDFAKFEDEFGEEAYRNGYFYLKVLLTASENFSVDKMREGKTEVIIKVISNQEKIKAFIPEVDSIDDKNKKAKLKDSSTLICEDSAYDDKNKEVEKNYCFVAKNQIIGVTFANEDKEYADFSWTLDGQNLSCDTTISDDCADDKETNFNFFPITKDAGGTYTLVMKANNAEKGKSLELVRKFIVIDPYILIVSPDKEKVWRTYLGRYLSLDDSCNNAEGCYDFSDSEFETSWGNEVTMKAEFHPSWIESEMTDAEGKSNLKWTVNGLGQDDDGFADLYKIVGNSVSFRTDGDDVIVGSAFNIGLSGDYYQKKETRKALFYLWNINQFETIEKNLSHSARVEVLPIDAGEGVVLGKYRNFFAAMFTNAPSNIVFAIRLILAVFVVIFLSGLAQSFSPKKYF